MAPTERHFATYVEREERGAKWQVRRQQLTFISGFMLVGAAYCESMAVFTLNNRRFGLPVTIHFDILPVGRTKLPCLLLQGELLSAHTCAASDLSSKFMWRRAAACNVFKRTLQSQERCGSVHTVLQAGAGKGAKKQHDSCGMRLQRNWAQEYCAQLRAGTGRISC